MKHIYKIIITVALLLFASTAFSNQWDIDPDHSEIRFKVKHIHTTVSGHFYDFKGDIFFNPENLDDSKFDFTVNVKSVDTNNGKRDNHLRSKDFFNSNKFHVMTFKSTKIRQNMDLMIIAIRKKNNKMKFNPKASTVIEAGDTMVIAGSGRSLKQLENILYV